MEVKLQPFDFNAALARAGLDTSGNRIQGTQAARQAASAKAVGGTSFGDAMSAALKDVSQTQNQATQMQREVQLDNPNVSLEETMVAVQKAQIGFQAVLQVRNRLVSAYSEIMNMQV
ncbi:flagellar hook-basal body complex protein FliE [Burkholderiaceae bacterium UC74_6]